MNFFLLVSSLVIIQPAVRSVYTEQEHVKNYISFALNSYRDFYNSNTNFVYSPLSLSVIYNILYQSASGNGETKLQEVLFSNTQIQPDKYEIFQRQTESLAQIVLNSNSSVKLANKFYSNNGFVFDTIFKYFADQYRIPLENIDFSRAELAGNVMNNWVKIQTNDFIKDLIQTDQIHPFTFMVIVNTVYFTAEWLRKYSPNYVQEGFFKSTTCRSNPIQFIEDTQSYDISFRPALGVYALRIPYRTGFEFWIILPFANYPIDDLVKSLTAEHITDIKDNFESKHAQIKFPIFTIESRIDGRTTKPDAFVYSDFQIYDGFQSVVGPIIQKTKIVINTEGTEPAPNIDRQSGPITSSPHPPSEPFYFIADRPFLYAVMDENNLPILIGHYTC